jgi:hypothetical protein
MAQWYGNDPAAWNEMKTGRLQRAIVRSERVRHPIRRFVSLGQQREVIPSSVGSRGRCAARGSFP